jgi:hypothetical protein
MKRRKFLKMSAAASLGAFAHRASSAAAGMRSHTFYVALTGSDAHLGTERSPFLTLHRAQQAVQDFRRSNPDIGVTVLVRKGTYYLGKTLVFTPEDSGTGQAPVLYQAFPGEEVTLSGGRKLVCPWQHRGPDMICDLGTANSGPFSFTQLFINGKRQIRARFPDYDSSSPGKSGYVRAVRAIPPGTSSPDPVVQAILEELAPNANRVLGIEFDPATFGHRRWGNPQEAVIHIFQDEGYGMLDWEILSIDYDRNLIWFGEGGDQLGPNWSSQSNMVGSNSLFYVDNLAEENDSPGEWYLSAGMGRLDYRASKISDMMSALVEVPVLDNIIRMSGTADRPVEHISIEGFRLAHTSSTYTEPYEALQGSKWGFHRGGAIFLERTGNCSIRNCWFDAAGGNAVFWSGPNIRGSISGCTFTEAGDNAICFAGANDNSNECPVGCDASDNLIHDCGVFGKQIAGILIASARNITAAHNDIYNMPCSAIAIADGFAGKHKVAHNKFHDVNRETRHHGAINAWGSAASSKADPVTIYGNLVRDTAGPAILLASNASNFDIYNNIADGASIRIGSGAGRNIHNNICYKATAPVSFVDGDGRNAGSRVADQFQRNITVIHGRDMIAVSSATPQRPRLGDIDNNCYFSQEGDFCAFVRGPRQWTGPEDSPRHLSFTQWRDLGFDQHSVFANPMLADPAHLDFRVLAGSPASKIGFKNFPLKQWGLTRAASLKWKK